MKRLGPILMIAFGSVLTFGGLTSGGVRAETVLPPCETVPVTAAEIIPNAASVQITVVDPPPCDPCDTAPSEIGVQDPCQDPDPCDINVGAVRGALVQISIPCPDPCDTIPDLPSAVGADVSVPDTVDPCAPATTLAPTTTTLAVSTTLNGSGAQLPATGSSTSGIKLVIGLSLVSLGSVLLLVRRRSRPAPLA